VVADTDAAHDDAVAQAHAITDDAALANADIGAQLAVHANLGGGGHQHAADYTWLLVQLLGLLDVERVQVQGKA
jgi:hypothetical protein